jgi:flavin-dependent dehydrogenase
MQTVDIIIIGAGPAGLSTALHLIKKDPSWKTRLVVLEKTQHPRHKLCGGGVTVFGLDILKDLDLPTPFPLPHTVIEDARFVYRNWTTHVHGNPLFLVYNREEFDAYLADQARKKRKVSPSRQIMESIALRLSLVQMDRKESPGDS